MAFSRIPSRNSASVDPDRDSRFSSTTTMAGSSAFNRSASTGGNASANRNSSFEGKRPARAREFMLKFGKRHHSYDPEKAPYPVSYDKQDSEMDALDHAFKTSIYKSSSIIDWKGEGPPEKSLDLGCGAGYWIAYAAQEWPECHFVGFDLVDMQLPLHLLDPSIAERVTFVHGNFLTTKLPFDDDEFDHVHISGIARGVPENKWGVLFDEVHRVLRPGGAVEMSEEDIIFPVLPRWFTSPLRHRVRRTSSVHMPDGAPRSSLPSPPPSPGRTTHDHALLESLFDAVYSSRFINKKPTAILPSYFTQVFRQVTAPPVVVFPMPPYPPLPPLPTQKHLSTLNTSDPSTWSQYSGPSRPKSRPPSRSFDSSVSYATSASATESMDSAVLSNSDYCSARSSFATSEAESPTDDRDTPTSCSRRPSASLPSSTKRPNVVGGNYTPPQAGRRSVADFTSPDEAATLGFGTGPINRDRLTSLSARSLTMHLYRAFQGVLSCQEAMWEELKDRILNKKEQLVAFGWEDDEELEGLAQSRQKFERLVERYKSDMQARLGLWHCLTEVGWSTPPRDPLSKAELIEEDRIRQAMMHAQKEAAEEELLENSRRWRLLIGYKVG